MKERKAERNKVTGVRERPQKGELKCCDQKLALEKRLQRNGKSKTERARERRERERERERKKIEKTKIRKGKKESVVKCVFIERERVSINK